MVDLGPIAPLPWEAFDETHSDHADWVEQTGRCFGRCLSHHDCHHTSLQHGADGCNVPGCLCAFMSWDEEDDDADIVLHSSEAPIVGRIHGLHGREQVDEVINQLLGDCGEEN